MKIVLLAAAAGMTLASATAFAGEGAGDPFPFRAPPLTTTVTNWKGDQTRLDDPYGYRSTNSLASPGEGQMLPANGSEGSVQSANGLPAGFASGTATFDQARSMDAYYRRANPTRPAPSVAQGNGTALAPHG